MGHTDKKADEVEEMGGKFSLPGAVAICLYWHAKESGAQVPASLAIALFPPISLFHFHLNLSRRPSLGRA